MAQPEGLNSALPPVRECCVPLLSALDQRVTEANWCNCLCYWTPMAVFTPMNWLYCLCCSPLIPCCCGCYDTEQPAAQQNVTVNVTTGATQ
jgi:hypothetical protein